LKTTLSLAQDLASQFRTIFSGDSTSSDLVRHECEERYNPQDYGLAFSPERASSRAPLGVKFSKWTPRRRLSLEISSWEVSVGQELQVVVKVSHDGAEFTASSISLLLTTPRQHSVCNSRVVSHLRKGESAQVVATLKIEAEHLVDPFLEVAVLLTYSATEDLSPATSFCVEQLGWRQVNPRAGGSANQSHKKLDDTLASSLHHLGHCVDLIIIGPQTPMTRDFILGLPDSVSTILGLLQLSNSSTKPFPAFFADASRELSVEVRYLGDYHAPVSLRASSEVRLLATLATFSSRLPSHLRLEADRATAVFPKLRELIQGLKAEISLTIEFCSKMLEELRRDQNLAEPGGGDAEQLIKVYDKRTREILLAKAKTDQKFLWLFPDNPFRYP